MSLYGPRDRNLLRETTHLDAAGRYQFVGLPIGQYWITVATETDVHVEAYPHEREVFCTGGRLGDIDFQLR